MPRAHETLVVLGLVATVACGPKVALDFDDAGGGTDEGSGDGTTIASGAGVEDGGGRDTGGGVGDGNPDDGDPTGDGAPGDPGECWNVQGLFKVPDDVAVFAVDQDGDGAQEIWVASNTDGGPGPGSTSLFQIGDAGVPGPEIELGAYLVAMPDIDGDGLLDLLLVQFSMGPPPIFAWARGHADGTFELPGIPSDLELGANVSGFFDGDGDLLADAFALTNDGTLQMLRGDGLGGFALTSELPLAIDGFGFVSPVEHASGVGLLQTQAGFGGPGGGGGGGNDCRPREVRLVRTTGGVLEDWAATEPGIGLGPLVRAWSLGSQVTAYTRSCSDSGEYLPELRQVAVQPGDAVILEGAAFTDITWAAPADLDGDGDMDIALAEPGAEEIAWARGLDLLGERETIPVSNPEVRDNNVRAVDLDGDGREELLRGWVLTDGDPASLNYDRIWLGPCE